MKRLLIMPFILLCALAGTYGQPTEGVPYKGYAEYLTLKDGKIIIDSFDFEKRLNENFVCNYEIFYDHGIPFINIADPIASKWLFLSSPEYIVAYKNNADSFFLGGIGAIAGCDDVRKATYSATSYLSENGIEYCPANLGDSTPDHPWVEGVKGSGIGEKIQLKLQTWKENNGEAGGMGALIISNGYVSYSNPSLYYKNNRVKRIRISSRNPVFSFEMTLPDTPNPQIIKLPMPPEEVSIEILSVYRGTDWDDTCVNFIYVLELNQAKNLK